MKNPLKVAGASFLAATGITALIDKKKFSDVFAKNIKKGFDAAKPVTKEIIKAAGKGAKEVLKEVNNGANEVLTSIVGKKNLLYAKYALITFAVLILLYYIKQIL